MNYPNGLDAQHWQDGLRLSLVSKDRIAAALSIELGLNECYMDSEKVETHIEFWTKI